jgi:uncharacterized Zn finger protein
MRCDRCGSLNTEVIRKSEKGSWYFAVHCKDCGEDRLPTPTERDNFNG